MGVCMVNESSTGYEEMLEAWICRKIIQIVVPLDDDDDDYHIKFPVWTRWNSVETDGHAPYTTEMDLLSWQKRIYCV